MKTSMTILAIFLLGFSSIALAQKDTTWNRWSWLIGDWVGEGSGTPGQGSGWFSFHLDLKGKILLRKSHSEYPATKDQPEIVHDDMMVVYPDDSNHNDKAIYFDNEGHVINYSITDSEKAIVFISSKAQNPPMFRLTYMPIDNETVDVRFEISQDGAKFVTYVEGKCRKKK